MAAFLTLAVLAFLLRSTSEPRLDGARSRSVAPLESEVAGCGNAEEGTRPEGASRSADSEPGSGPAASTTTVHGAEPDRARAISAASAPLSGEEVPDSASPHFDIPVVDGTHGPERETWARHALRFTPSSVVELPGHYPAADCSVFAEIVGPDGSVEMAKECPFVRLSETVLVALVPTSRRSGTSLRLILRSPGARVHVVKVRLSDQGPFTSPEAREQIDGLLRFPSNSAVSRAFRKRLAEGQDRKAALAAIREDVLRVTDLLRLQFAPEDVNAVDRLARSYAADDVEKTAAAALKRIDADGSR